MSSTTPPPTDYHALLKRALLSLEKLQSRLDTFEHSKSEALAIIGVGCRFPGGAETPEGYWQLLRNGVDAVTEVPADRWDIEAYYDSRPGTAGKMNTRYGAFIGPVDQFDPQFFGIAPREAISMDPQQRLVLEVAWEALEQAGQAPDKLVGSATGVFIGISNSDYARLVDDPGHINTYTSTGISLSIAAGRLSYVLGLQGPSLAVDTACSSSLVAIHLACQSLRQRECRMAIAGGVNLLLSPLATISLCELSMMAPDGRCKTFDQAANGFVRGEGCGLVVLKRLSDALADGDSIMALVRGTAINQDGRSSGLTAPNGPSQEAVIRQALADGRVAPEQVSYVEAHGTGTALGDPIEVAALGAVLGAQRSAEYPLMIGSVKTNIGHLEAAAGVSGLIKVVLALQHGEVPPHLHLQVPSPHISWASLPVVVPTVSRPWPSGNGRRLAGVSSFGFGGTNAHVVLEEAPPRETVPVAPERPLHLLTLSAKTEPALKQLAQRFSTYLSNQPTASLADICFTANTGRAHFSHRLAVTTGSITQASAQLAAFAGGQPTQDLQSNRFEQSSPPRIAFLFTGQGSQYPGMGSQLFATQPTFRRRLQECDELLRPHLEHSLLSVLYGEQGALLAQTAYTQPALFALEYALAELWRSWGIEPDVVLGHSVGEYVAACVAGVFTLSDGLRLLAARGRLMQSVKAAGGMAAVFADEARVRAAIAPYERELSIAALNTPGQVVISGARAAMAMVLQNLSAQAVRAEPLHVSHAFHSPLMDEMLDEFEQVAGEIHYAPPQVRVVSNLTGELAEDEILQQAGYWRKQAREAVQFSNGIKTLTKERCEIYLEIGPSATLLGMARQTNAEPRTAWLPSIRNGRPEWDQILESLGQLYVRGVKVDWAGVEGERRGQRVSLPTYPFQRERFWIQDARVKGSRQSRLTEQAAKPQSTPGQLADWLYQVEWRPMALSTTAFSQDDLVLPDNGRPQTAVGGVELDPDEQSVHGAALEKQTATPEQNTGWLILADRMGVGRELAVLFIKMGRRVVLVHAGEAYEFLRPGEARVNPGEASQFERLLADINDIPDFVCDGVVYLWGLDSAPVEQTTAASLEIDQSIGCGGILYLVQALAKSAAIRDGRPSRLWLITRGAEAVNRTQRLEIAQAPVWGLGRVVALEHPEIWGGLVDLEPASLAENAATLAAETQSSDGEDQIAYRQGKRYVARLVRSENRELLTTQPSLRADGTYLITGGLGGLGLSIARWLVNNGARHLVLTGRKIFPERSTWSSVDHNPNTRRALTAIQEIENEGATVRIAQADTSDKQQMTELFRQIGSTNLPLRGIIHAAAEVNAQALKDMDHNALMAMLRPKVIGAWILHELTEQLDLDWFVMFSSISSLLGSMHLAHYAAANHFLDSFAHYRHALNLPVLSINWGRWGDDGPPEASEKQLFFSQYGLDAMPRDQALQVLGQLMATNTVQKTVAAINWHLLKPVYEAKRQRPFLEEFDTQSQRAAEATEFINLWPQLQDTAPSKRRDLLVRHIQSEVTRVLGFNLNRAVDTRQGFFEMGMDSLTSVELKDRLEQSLSCTLHATVVFEYSSVEALAQYLEHELFGSDAEPTGKITTDELAKDATALNDLSRDDLLALLAAELRDGQP